MASEVDTYTAITCIPTARRDPAIEDVLPEYNVARFTRYSIIACCPAMARESMHTTDGIITVPQHLLGYGPGDNVRVVKADACDTGVLQAFSLVAVFTYQQLAFY